MMSESLTLKRYPNRRLYDTEQSRYVTLAQVTAMIKRGRAVEVREAGSDEDVTAFVLTAILLEEAKRKHALLPAPILHLLIRFGDNLLVDFFQNSLQGIIQAYLTQKASFDEGLRRWVQMGLDVTDNAAKVMSGILPFSGLFEPGGASGTPEKKDQG
jgi:polyhydroxyalkanoate synthesis repressor PhaR